MSKLKYFEFWKFWLSCSCLLQALYGTDGKGKVEAEGGWVGDKKN